MPLSIHVSPASSGLFAHIRLGLDGGFEAGLDLDLERWNQVPNWKDMTCAVSQKSALEAYGAGLFAALMQSSPEARALWAEAEKRIGRLRVEIYDPGSALAWELLRSAPANQPLACLAESFVRCAPGRSSWTRAGKGGEKTRILFVVPRIRAGEKARYQSTALRLVNGLCATCRDFFELDWLETPTFGHLSQRLSRANQSGQPYHVLHYDGFGIAGLDGEDTADGALVLEGAGKAEPTPGGILAALLVEQRVAILSLNAAYESAEADETRRGLQAVARRALEGGVPAALVMPWVVDGHAAAKALGDIYAALAQGESLGAAVASERRYLYNRPAEATAELAWSVPQAYENQPERIAAKAEVDNAPIFRITIQPRGQERVPAEMDPGLKRRALRDDKNKLDEWLLYIDQAFEANRIILLAGPDSAAITAIAAEYTRWQGNINALGGQPVLYTSLRDCFTFTDLLEDFGLAYEKALLDLGVNWQALDDPARGKLIRDLAQKTPLFWVWDHMESIRSDAAWRWSADEREKAFDFLRDLPAGMGRILLLSQDEETGVEPFALRIPYRLQRDETKLEKKLSGFSIDEKRWLSLGGLFGGPIHFPLLSRIVQYRLQRRSEEDLRRVYEKAAQAGLLTQYAEGVIEVLGPSRKLLAAQYKRHLTGRQIRYSFTQAACDIASELVAAHDVRTAAAVESCMRSALEFASMAERPDEVDAILPALRLAMMSRRKYAAWARVVDDCAPLFLTRKGSRLVMRKGEEQAAKRLIGYGVEINRLRGRLAEARAWQAILVGDLWKKRALIPAEELIAALSLMADLHLAAGSPQAIDMLHKCYRLEGGSGQATRAAETALKIAAAAVQIPAARNLRRAQSWIATSRNLFGPDQPVGLARCLVLEGNVAYESFLQAQKENAATERQVKFLNTALACTFEALELIPPEESVEAAKIYEMIGFLYIQANQMHEEAVGHYDRAIVLFEKSGDFAGANRARFNLAVALFLLADFERARRYNQDALRGFEALGAGYAEDRQKAARLLQRFASNQ